jgi:hypothetical protein
MEKESAVNVKRLRGGHTFAAEGVTSQLNAAQSEMFTAM